MRIRTLVVPFGALAYGVDAALSRILILNGVDADLFGRLPSASLGTSSNGQRRRYWYDPALPTTGATPRGLLVPEVAVVTGLPQDAV
jgi:hypothetical protein